MGVSSPIKNEIDGIDFCSKKRKNGKIIAIFQRKLEIEIYLTKKIKGKKLNRT